MCPLPLHHSEFTTPNPPILPPIQKKNILHIPHLAPVIIPTPTQFTSYKHRQTTKTFAHLRKLLPFDLHFYRAPIGVEFKNAPTKMSTNSLR